jgi:hypothetical protein
MRDRLRSSSDRDLELALLDLQARIAYPPTPDLARRVRERLIAQPISRRTQWSEWLFPLRRGLAVAAIALLVLAGAVLALSPQARTALADRLGLRGIQLFEAPSAPDHGAATPNPAATLPATRVATATSRLLPDPTATLARAAAPSASPIASPTTAHPPVATRGALGWSLGLGTATRLEQARASVPYEVRIPTLEGLGVPDEVYVLSYPPGGQVALVFGPRSGLPEAAETGVGLLFTQFRAELDTRFIEKSVGPSTRVEQLTVNGGLGFWLDGPAHLFIYRDQTGEIRDESIRLAGNTLIWEQGELTMRIEGQMSREKALQIAASIR